MSASQVFETTDGHSHADDALDGSAGCDNNLPFGHETAVQDVACALAGRALEAFILRPDLKLFQNYGLKLLWVLLKVFWRK